jgi:hypothetical protein
MLVLQIITKQWDKSQRTAAHVLERTNIPDRYPIIFPAAFYDLNNPGKDCQAMKTTLNQAYDLPCHSD